MPAIGETTLLPGQMAEVSLQWSEEVRAAERALAGDALVVLVPEHDHLRRMQPPVATLASIAAHQRVATDASPLAIRVLGLRRVELVGEPRWWPDSTVRIQDFADQGLGADIPVVLHELRRLRRLASRALGELSVRSDDDLRGLEVAEIVDLLPLLLRMPAADKVALLASSTVLGRLEVIGRWLRHQQRRLRPPPVRRPKAKPEGTAARVETLPPLIRERASRLQDRGIYDRSDEVLRVVVEMAWEAPQAPAYDLAAATTALDRSHAGMRPVKDAVLDFLGVSEWRRRRGLAPAGQVLCLVGPPGVGKTSIAETIASASDRCVATFALGGVDDVFLQGCDRAYQHSRPGELVRRLSQLHRHPSEMVILLDEIDKIQDSGTHSVLSTLLSLLDPRQNSSWRDHYLNEFPLDFSGALFIATANQADDIAPALRDRLRLIQLPGYSAEEQIAIGRDYILPQLLGALGISGEVAVSPPALESLVRDFPTSPGMRQLEDRLEALTARALREHLTTNRDVEVTRDLARRWLRKEMGTTGIGFRRPASTRASLAPSLD